MFCVSNDTTFASWAPACSEKTPPDENHHLSKFILSYTHAMFSNITTQMYPGRFCGSNDTIFASWAPVCSEKTPPDENHHLSKFFMSYIHATF